MHTQVYKFKEDKPNVIMYNGVVKDCFIMTGL